MTDPVSGASVLERVFEVIRSRRGGDAEVGITPDDVWAELRKREGAPSGRQAKADTETG